MENRDFKIIAAIADIHIGNKAIAWSEYKYQIKHGIVDKLDNMAFLDGIVICGDTLHYQISMNSEYANVFQWFISKIIKIAKKKNAFIRIIKGTKSHDLDQLETIRHYEDNFDVDFKIIDDYLIETIDGHNYAYIAENYINLPIKEYYSDIFDKDTDYFDMIFGHGTIEQTQFTNQYSENISSNAPIFKLKDFYKVCKGPIIFGHIHTPMVFNNKFYYVGSALRTCHGEEEPKGWNVIGYIKDTGCYRVDKIVNEFTFNFKKIELNDKFICDNDIDHIVDHINTIMDRDKVDRLSVSVICVEDDDTLVKIELLKKYLAKDKNITANFRILSKKAYERDVTIREKKEIKSYLKDGLDIVDRIRLWALEKRNCRLENDDIRKFITPETLKRKGV